MKKGFIDRWLERRASELARNIADSIHSDAGAWTSDDGFYLRHRSGVVTIWIANQAFGLRLEISDDQGPGMSAPLSKADVRLIWRAVRRLRIPSTEEVCYRRALARLPVSIREKV